MSRVLAQTALTFQLATATWTGTAGRAARSACHRSAAAADSAKSALHRRRTPWAEAVTTWARPIASPVTADKWARRASSSVDQTPPPGWLTTA